MSRRFARFVADMACFLGVAAFAQSQPPEIDRSLAWLTSQARADGRLVDEATSIALPLQSQAETINTLSLFAAAPSVVVVRVDSPHLPLAEYLARRALTLDVARQDASAPMEDLAKLRNPDAG